MCYSDKNPYLMIKTGLGLNKTGTTLLRQAMLDSGYIIDNQIKVELLFDDWVKRDFQKIIKYCRTVQFFQIESMKSYLNF